MIYIRWVPCLTQDGGHLCYCLASRHSAIKSYDDSAIVVPYTHTHTHAPLPPQVALEAHLFDATLPPLYPPTLIAMEAHHFDLSSLYFFSYLINISNCILLATTISLCSWWEIMPISSTVKKALSLLILNSV